MLAVVGASGGIGGAVARRLAARGPVLLGYFSNEARAATLVQEIVEAGGRAEARQVDLRDPGSVAGFLGRADAGEGGLGGIVSVSGAPFPMCPLVEGDPDEFRAILETEVVGTFNLLAKGVPLLKARGGGGIVLFLTTAVLRTMDYDGMNSVPKAAIAMMLRHVAREAGPGNVRINGIAPGVIDAGRTDIVDSLPPLVQQVVARCLEDTPVKRLGRPDEVAAMVDHLLSKQAAYINGQIIAVDGGYSA